MKDIDHKLSREIVNTAKAHDVSVSKLERLQNIRSTTRTSRKNNHNLHMLWEKNSVSLPAQWSPGKWSMPCANWDSTMCSILISLPTSPLWKKAPKF